jgi:hypothetical protein
MQILLKYQLEEDSIVVDELFSLHLTLKNEICVVVNSFLFL